MILLFFIYFKMERKRENQRSIGWYSVWCIFTVLNDDVRIVAYSPSAIHSILLLSCEMEKMEQQNQQCTQHTDIVMDRIDRRRAEKVKSQNFHFVLALTTTTSTKATTIPQSIESTRPITNLLKWVQFCTYFCIAFHLTNLKPYM